MNRQKPVVLAVGGSDSGGGAGIQADIKTITMCGGYAATAITAITAQNTTGVHQIKLLDPELLRAQIRVVLDDFEVSCVKIGMLGNAEMINTVVKEFKHTKIPIILDPVMIAKGGASLLQKTAIKALQNNFIPISYLLTPNAPEAEKLSGLSVVDLDGQRRAASAILKMGAQAVLIKGGHLPGDTVHDLLLWRHGEVVFESARINSRHTHGTGCTLASAIASWLAQGLQLEEAIRMARDYVRNAILHAPELGKGHGPLGHNWTLYGKQK